MYTKPTFVYTKIKTSTITTTNNTAENQPKTEIYNTPEALCDAGNLIGGRPHCLLLLSYLGWVVLYCVCAR
jgi:hypothetical protein